MKPIEAQRELRKRIQGRRNDAIDLVAPLMPGEKGIALEKVPGRKFLHLPAKPLYKNWYHPGKSARNAMCPCGSGRQFKKCCIKETV